MITLDALLDHLRGLAPESTALPGDPVGLLIEPSRGDLGRIGVCLDATADVARRALDEGVDLLIAHHPLIYHPLKRLMPSTDPIAAVALMLAHAGCGVYAMHTNWDVAAGGINDTLAELLGLTDVRTLGASGKEAIPRIGTLPTATTYGLLRHSVAQTLGCAGPTALRWTPLSDDRPVRTVAVCGGAGAELAGTAMGAGADAYVTSDVAHHEFLDAAARGLAMIDAGHQTTEAPGMEALALRLKSELPSVDIVWFATA